MDISPRSLSRRHVCLGAVALASPEPVEFGAIETAR